MRLRPGHARRAGGAGKDTRGHAAVPGLVAVTMLALLSGCTTDHRLRALRSDPLADVAVTGTQEVRRTEQSSDVDGGLLGKPREAKITRTLELDDPGTGPAALAAAVARAKEAGWEEPADGGQSPHSFSGERTIDGVHCRVLLYLTDEHGLDKKIFPRRTLMVYLAASNSD